MIRSTDYLRRISHDVLLVSELQQFHLGRLHLVGLWGKGRNNWWCAICGKKYDWKQANRLLVVQTGESIDQAKVFKTHAVPQGLCGTLNNALKLLANQQEDGDGFIQNIVKNLGKGNRKSLTERLRLHKLEHGNIESTKTESSRGSGKFG